MAGKIWGDDAKKGNKKGGVMPRLGLCQFQFDLTFAMQKSGHRTNQWLRRVCKF